MMYGSPGCPNRKFPSLHSKKVRIGQKMALKWTKTLADLHKCVLMVNTKLFIACTYFLDSVVFPFYSVHYKKVFTSWVLTIKM